MNIFEKIKLLLGIKKTKQKNAEEVLKAKAEDIIEITREEFEKTVEFKTFLSNSTLKTIMLRPHLSDNPICSNKSKMGGIPNLRNFNAYPKCDNCKSYLNFVLQLYKTKFSDFYFPDNNNLFQIFRCPNNNCVTGNELLKYDHKTFIYYFEDNENQVSNLKILNSLKLESFELEVPDCEFKPMYENDYPDHYDYKGEELKILEAKYGDEWSDYIFENYRAKTGTKCNGYPAWTQFPVWPKCKCGKIKEFFFQLSSEDKEENLNPNISRWSPHRIMMGDVGNMYFFVCKKCGESSIETNWDCS